VNVKPHILAPILVCALVAGAAVATAQTSPDSTGMHPDTTHTAPATTTAAPPAAAATAAPTTTTTPPATQTAPATQAAPTKKWYQDENIYFGGTATFSFGSTSSISIYPMMGYKVTPRMSFGAEVGYEHVSYNGGSTDNYGVGLFSRQFLKRRRGIFAYEELKTVNYEIFDGPNSSHRDWVPFAFLGGGFSRPISPRTSIYAEVVFDVLQDDLSPYDQWEPIVTIGVGSGF
jgi:hypothetical protein